MCEELTLADAIEMANEIDALSDILCEALEDAVTAGNQFHDMSNMKVVYLTASFSALARMCKSVSDIISENMP